MKVPLNFSKFIWDFQRAYMTKRISFITKDFPGLQKLLNDMYIEGFITGYTNLIQKSSTVNMIEIFLKYDFLGNSIYFSCKNISKPSLDAIIQLPQLKAELNNEPFALWIVRTSKLGITTTKQALKNKTGGIYLGKIK
jgi:ribosomal protein S8